jgi:hypothetical protein
VDKAIFQNGDLLYRAGNGFFSKYFKQVSDSVQLYSHAGIIQVEGDSVFVIHSEASELTFIGYVQRQPVEVFLQDIETWALYRLERPAHQRDKVLQIAYDYHRQQVPFDMDFSMDDDSEIYCTELLALCVNKALGEELILPNTRIMGKMGYDVDDTFLVEGIKEVFKFQEPVK